MALYEGAEGVDFFLRGGIQGSRPMGQTGWIRPELRRASAGNFRGEPIRFPGCFATDGDLGKRAWDAPTWPASEPYEAVFVLRQRRDCYSLTGALRPEKWDLRSATRVFTRARIRNLIIIILFQPRPRRGASRGSGAL